MGKFINGIMFTVGATMFGKAMYRLGENNERKRIAKNLKLMIILGEKFKEEKEEEA